MNDISFRFMEPGDIPALLEIDQQTWSPHNSPGAYPQNDAGLQKLECDHVVVACVSDRPVGYVILMETLRPPTSSHVVTLAIVVHPGWQGKGIGSRLLQQAEQWVRNRGKTKLSLRVLATNPRAVQLYERCGFVQEGSLHQEFLIGGRFVDDILMYKLV